MSQWSERFKDHAVWKQMEALGPAIDAALSREDLDAETVAGWGRLRTVLTFTGKRLAGADRLLIHPPALDGIAAQLQNAVTEAKTFAEDGNLDRVNAVNGYADALLGYVSGLNYPFVADDLQALREAGDTYRASLEQATNSHNETAKQKTLDLAASIQALSSKLDDARQRVVELAAELKAERDRVTSLTSDFQGQFSTAQESRSKEFGDAQASRLKTFGELAAEYTKNLTEQDAEYTKQREDHGRQYDEHVASLVAQYGKAAEDLLASIRKEKEQVEKLVGVIGNLGVTSGYLTTANEARSARQLWQTATVASLLSVVGVAVYAFLPALKADASLSWQTIVARLVICMTVGVLAAYTSAQADRNAELERRNRKLALELEAIGPYLANLPPERQEAIRVRLANRSFGRPEGAFGRWRRSPATLFDVISSSKSVPEVLKGVTELAKVLRGGDKHPGA